MIVDLDALPQDWQNEDIVFNSEEDEKAYYEALGAERKEE